MQPHHGYSLTQYRQDCRQHAASRPGTGHLLKDTREFECEDDLAGYGGLFQHKSCRTPALHACLKMPCPTCPAAAVPATELPVTTTTSSLPPLSPQHQSPPLPHPPTTCLTCN
ncbi:hypothetical protein E2C01_069310 [Portunus trituberculatus]|uniref:Uncharacterized protein n=1 Tax=Portunus trituberculatus TaxID=210409 RepID=A0A5B7HR87_PORTR|nr:hypothetical protein [Portunus trituberculatus]